MSHQGTVPRDVGAGLRRWFAVTGGIFAWMVHEIADSALTRVACRHDASWVMHVITAATAALAAAALWAAISLIREGGDAEDAPTAVGRDRFLGYFAAILNVLNIVLILFEGSYVVIVGPCR